MPHRRQVQRGSFGAHFDELVKHFTEHAEPRHERSRSLQEKLDIHTRLFEQAWELERD